MLMSCWCWFNVVSGTYAGAPSDQWCQCLTWVTSAMRPCQCHHIPPPHYYCCYYHYHYTHTHLFNGPLFRTTWVSRYQKGKTNLDVTEARNSEWQWHQLGHMQVCILLQIDNHTSTPSLSFIQAGCPSSHPTNNVKPLKALLYIPLPLKNSVK